MIKPGTIRIIATESLRKYAVEYFDNGEREIIVTSTVAKLITAAMEQGKIELRQELKKALEG